MKHLILLLFTLAWGLSPCYAQFGFIKKIGKALKTGERTVETAPPADNDVYNMKIKDIRKELAKDTTSVEYKKNIEQARKEMENDPEYQKLIKFCSDSVALRKYVEENYSGLNEEEIRVKSLKEAGMDIDSREFKESMKQAQTMSGFTDDPVFEKIVAEQRQPTEEEARYLNGKYGTNFEYEGMEAYNDSVGVFANIEGKLQSVKLSNYSITNIRPMPDFGLDGLKRYLNDFISTLKNPFADREVVDSIQNYLVYGNAHADATFNGQAHFTIYSNLETNTDEMTMDEVLRRQIACFTSSIDPKDIFVFKLHKAFDSRYMEYQYTKISYKMSEMMDYVTQRLETEGYLDANIDRKISGRQLYDVIDNMKEDFKNTKRLMMALGDKKYIYNNAVPEAKNVKISSNTRMVGGHVTALDLCIDAEPGEYGFVIMNQEDEKKYRAETKDTNFEMSVLSKGVYLFTVK